MNPREHGFDSQALRDVWTQVCATAPDALTDARQRFGVDFANASIGVWEPEGFSYTPVTLIHQEGGRLAVDQVVFALSDRRLVTSQPAVPFSVFNDAITQMTKMPELALTPHGVMYALLNAMNEASRQTLGGIQSQLDALGDAVLAATRARHGAAVLTARQALWKMTQVRREVSRVLRAQADLTRAARRLYSTGTDPWLLDLAESLQAELNSLKEEADIEYDMLRFLQQLTTGLLAGRSPSVKPVALMALLALGAWVNAIAWMFPGRDWWGWPCLVLGTTAVFISLLVLIGSSRRR